MKRFLILILSLVATVVELSAREVVSINDDWRFYFTSENSADYARSISLPHTWAYDATRSIMSPQPTTANYLRTIYVPEEWSGKRLFLKFYGVESIAELFVNGQYVGEHRGGATAFTFEITSKVKVGAENRVQVIVNNAPQNDILPTSREEDNYGGIYRDVELIVTDRSAISPLYYGSSGVLIQTNEASEQKASGVAKIYLTSTASQTCNLSLTIFDKSGAVVYQRFVNKARITDEPIEVPFSVAKPALWSPSSPQMYTFVADLSDGDMHDVVSVESGFREIDINYDGLISINDKATQMRIVTLFHDYPYVGGAASKRDIATDVALVEEVGANMVRSAHHPHSQHLYNICNEMGIFAWIDLPFVKSPFLSDIAYYPTRRYKEQGFETLREIVAQNMNHPSVIMWGAFSLLSTRGDNPVPYITEVNNLAKELDPTRPTVALSNQDGALNNITDLIAWKQNIGWLRGTYSDIEVWSNLLHTEWKQLRSAVAYGESGRFDQQSRDEDFKAPHLVNAATWLPEGRQRHFHEEYAERLLTDSLFWGICLTNMFDFKSVRSTMGENNSGLMTFDRRDRKDVFYLYKANWNRSEPTLHLAARRERIVSSPMRRVTAYASDTITPLLLVNGDSVQMKLRPGAMFTADSVMLRPGANKIIIRQGELVDSAEWVLQNSMHVPSFGLNLGLIK